MDLWDFRIKLLHGPERQTMDNRWLVLSAQLLRHAHSQPGNQQHKTRKVIVSSGGRQSERQKEFPAEIWMGGNEMIAVLVHNSALQRLYLAEDDQG